MKIAHYKATPLAWAPDALSDAINRYSPHQSAVYTDPKAARRSGADLVHFHNVFFPVAQPACIQYHSPPDYKNLMHWQDHPSVPAMRLVIAQYHATLPEFADCRIVRNVLDWRRDEFRPRKAAALRIGYSPSCKERRGQWWDKGYERTVAILRSVAREVPGVEVDVITDTPLPECLRRKAACLVVIDECVTGSYHRSALEGTALGKYTICWLSPEVRRVLAKASGSKLLVPFHSVPIDKLEEHLVRLCCEKSAEEIRRIGAFARWWMETHWRPEDIVAEYCGIYQEVLACAS